MKRQAIFLFILCCLVQHSWAQDPSNVFKTDTLVKAKKYQFVGVPIVFYTPETSVGFGAGGQVFLLQQKNIYNKRISNVFFDVIYTSDKQFIIDVLPQIYFGKGNYYLDMSYKYKIFPSDFWGVGGNTPNSNEEPYDMTSQLINISFLKRLPPNLNFGFELFYQNYDVTQVEEGGLLASGDIVGSDGAIVSGFGVTFNLDTRDNISSPFSGSFVQIKAKFSSELFGATQGFNTFIADLRTYQKVGERSIVALQVYYQGNYGTLPFQAMAAYGGSATARGYYQGRFIDNNMYVAQAEYRYRFVPRWELAGFGLFGEVAPTPNDLFNFKDMKPSFGGGIRYKILKNQDTWVRVDLGKGIDGSSGFYFGVNEAF